jgi:glucuronokinase
MLVVKAQARPRASLLGNPSDLYGGAGIAFTFANCGAEVTITQAEATQLPRGLLAATLQVFAAHFGALPERPPFSAAIRSNIPRQVGLAGSSAVVIAFLRGLCKWYGLALDPCTLARLAMSVEVDVLRIRAGPMDRLAQAFEGLLHMDFAAPFEPQSTTRLPIEMLPRLAIVYDPKSFKSSGRVHQPVYERWLNGDPEVRAVIAEYRPLVQAGLAALQKRSRSELCRLMNYNFDLRARLFAIGERDRRMIDLGRSRGAATKFCGSGGAILVMTREPRDWPDLKQDYLAEGFRTIIPDCRAPA